MYCVTIYSYFIHSPQVCMGVVHSAELVLWAMVLVLCDNVSKTQQDVSVENQADTIGNLQSTSRIHNFIGGGEIAMVEIAPSVWPVYKFKRFSKNGFRVPSYLCSELRSEMRRFCPRTNEIQTGTKQVFSRLIHRRYETKQFDEDDGRRAETVHTPS